MNHSLREKESGVSPVIGVMLMIVITVIIAAVVSGFAGGLTDSSDDVPVATFEFKIYEKDIWSNKEGSTHGTARVNVIMKGGEAIDTGDLKVVSYYEHDDGNITRHESADLYSWSGLTGKGFTDGNYMHTGDEYRGFTSSLFGVSLESGDVIEVHMVHIPTNTVIWSDEVTVI